ncbi:GNAT family N-acetyltransferase [Spirilliplanes yamanashiensis]|nr:GNAT family N-acetyltransferase [Spirilliplanes yamanashiensis]MDP9816143.1 RimJ/RimL family protein N-acetyltransferase [Spirilliplanes yamanashiensis]
MEPVELHADDLTLRPWRPADADAVFKACQDPDIQRWVGLPAPYLREHAEHFTGRISPAAWADGTGAPFGVFADGQLVASVGVISVDRLLNSAEVGFWTAPWARGGNVAARATLALARWALDEVGFARLVWQAQLGNHASRLVALRAGFTISGELALAAPPDRRGRPGGWIGSLLPGRVPAAPVELPEGVRRRARLFGSAQPVLDAGTVRLRPLTGADVPGLVATCRDPLTVTWTTVPDPYRDTDAEWFVREHAADVWARGTGAVLALDDGDLAGVIELRVSPGDPAVADVGFMTAPRARGRGLMPAALRSLARWGLRDVGLDRVEWRAGVGNDASRRVAEKAGFRLEGVARGGIGHRGERRDAWVGALLPGDLTDEESA